MTCIECDASAKLISRAMMTPEEKAQSDKERDDAKTIAAEKREAAEQEETNASEGEKTAEYYRGLAANSRTVADKIHAL